MAKQNQIQKFKQAARELGTDNSEKRFNDKLGKIARQKPSDQNRSSDKKRKKG